MFFLNFHKSGWLKRYLIYRSSLPFELPAAYAELPENSGQSELYEALDECLYTEVKENGILFGCPIITPSLQELAKKLRFPKQQGGTILLYLETLFSAALAEFEKGTSSTQNAAETADSVRLTQILLRLLHYHLPDSYFRIPENLPLPELLENHESLSGALKQLETVLMDSVTLKGYSSMGNRQNNFAFAQLYFFLLWGRSLSAGELPNAAFCFEKDQQLREEMILAFAAVIWADEYVADIERQVVEKYIEQTRLPQAKQKQLSERIRQPVKVEHLKLSFSAKIIRSYLLEQLILLSLIGNQEAWQEQKLISRIAQQLGLSPEGVEQLSFSAAEFFAVHGKRLEFLKNNAAAQQFQEYMNDKVVVLVKKNVSSIMKEIEETKELSELLFKATAKPLTAEEKQKVQEQLLDIVKSIPALAIFALPGGGLLLPVLLKVLPFNILPSAFRDEPEKE